MNEIIEVTTFIEELNSALNLRISKPSELIGGLRTIILDDYEYFPYVVLYIDKECICIKRKCDCKKFRLLIENNQIKGNLVEQ